MKKGIFVILYIILTSSNIPAQNEENRKWVASFSFGLQAHDKRLFGFPPKEDVLARQPEIFGTYQLSIGMHRVIHTERKTFFTAGISISAEIATFSRPFDHNYFTGKGTYDLNWTDEYYKWLVHLPISLQYKALRKYSLRAEILPQINLVTVAKHSSFDKTYSKFNPGFYSAEFNASVNYAISKRISLGISYRAFQIKKIDKILFNYIVRDPRKDEKFETHNPFKLWLTVGYRL